MPLPQPRPGRRAALAAATLMMFSIGTLFAWSVFVDPLQNLFGQSRAAVSAVFSIATAGYMLGLLAGALLRRRYDRPVLAALTFLLASCGIGLSGLWSSLWAVWIGFGALFGIANGIGYALSLETAQDAMPHRPGLATGFAVTSYTVGSLIAAPLFGWGIAHVGPLSTLRATGVLMMPIGVAVVAMLLASASARDVNHRVPMEPGRRTASLFWLLWSGVLFSSLTGLLVLGHAAAIAQSVGQSAELSAFTVSLVAASSCAGRLAGGWAGDKGSPTRQASLLQILGGAGVLLVAVLPDPAMAAAGLALAAVGYGWMASAYPIIVTKLYGIESLTIVYSRINTAWGIAGIAASYAGGFLFDMFGSYRLALALAAASAVCAAISLGLVKIARTGPETGNELS